MKPDANTLTPDSILQLGLAFWGSKTLLSAVELGVFSALAHGPLPLKKAASQLGLHDRSARDFLDALVALGMLERDEAGYRNTPHTDLFLDRAKPSYIGGLLEMANERLYRFWGKLTPALQTGTSQNEAKTGGDPFAAMYADPHRLKLFLSGMTGISMGAALAIAEKFEWSRYSHFVDVGGAQGCVAVQLARAHHHLTGSNYDLSVVQPIFEEYVSSFQLQSRLSFIPGDFLKDEALPKTDVIVMGHILHDWDLATKKMLLKKAYDALPAGGAVIVYEAIIDDDRRHNAFGLLMSLNMLIETPGGFDYSGADCREWMLETGFDRVEVEHLCGPDSMVVGYK